MSKPLALSFVALSMLVSVPAEAVPAFARRYSLPCHFCHEGYPKLSVLGEEFKERGYRLDDDITEISEWLSSVPVSLRSTLRQSFEEEGDAETLGLFRFVSAGNLGSRFSYWIDESYSVSDDGFDRAGTDNAFLRLEILPDELYLRGGRIELDLPFTQARSPQLFSYELYFANTGFETDVIGAHQDGVELGGFLDDRTRWSVAVVKGRNSEEQEELSPDTDSFDGNVFARMMRRFGEGRAGAYLYWGRNTLARALPETGEVLSWEDDLFRFGLDASVYLGRSNLFGTFLYGRNSNSFADADTPSGTGESLSYAGAFLQLDVPVRDDIVLSGRFELVHMPPPETTGASETFSGFYPGLKIWLHARIRLAFELGFRNRGRPTRGAVHVELVL